MAVQALSASGGKAGFAPLCYVSQFQSPNPVLRLVLEFGLAIVACKSGQVNYRDIRTSSSIFKEIFPV
jgi:hypothetical protein